MDRRTWMDKALGKSKASVVLKNCRIVNVYTKTVEEGDIAIEDGHIIATGSYEGVVEHDIKGRFVAPGLIDGHVHIESSMVTPPGFARLVVPKGTTTVIADPHEIANVCGLDGIRFMLEESENIPLNVHMMLPSCVPATSFEHAGATLSAGDLSTLKDHPRVLGLGEVMDYPAVISGDHGIHEKIDMMRGRMIDGHAPDIMGRDLSAYAAAGIMTDHECTMVESMIDRVRNGMYVHLREGSQTRNTRTLLKGVNEAIIDRLLFCTDDKHPQDIRHEGHINFNVNLAIKAGIDPIDAIRMATLNAATCYGLRDVGGIAPGKRADLIVLDSLEDIQPVIVFKDGEIVAKDGEACFVTTGSKDKSVRDTVRFDDDTLDFSLPVSKNPVRVIGLVKNNITTRTLPRDVKTENGLYVHDPEIDILKLAVVERHHMTGNIGVGLLEGFGMKGGAIAMTISHDSHNLVVLGDDDRDMAVAAKAVKAIGGGVVLVKDHSVSKTLRLEIGGLMTEEDEGLVSGTIADIRETIVSMGLSEDVDDPMIALAFLSLPVIPELKLTDTGLFDVTRFVHVPIEAKGSDPS
jgi:adenine deaminase